MVQEAQLVTVEKRVTANVMEFADAHCHLNLFKNARDVLSESRKKGIGTVVTAGSSGRDNTENLELAGIDGVFAVVGISPDFSATDSAFIGKLVKLIKGNKKIVGIGEIGLDAKVVASNPFEVQMKVFSEQVGIAKDIGLPIVIHSRGYLDEVVKVLEQERVRGAMFHFFDGDEKQAVELAGKGHFISIPPADTGKRRRIIKEVGIGSLVVETDSPVVGRTPADVIGVCETIAKVKGITLEEAAATTTENIRRLFFI